MSTLPRCIPLRRQVAPNVEHVFHFLRTVAQDRCDGAVLRVAGGWVRDMVMGRESDDIDIAIETPRLWVEHHGGAATPPSPQSVTHSDSDADIPSVSPPPQPHRDMTGGGRLITGLSFAEAIVAYAKENPEHADPVGKVSVIDANPDKSKHLETAQITVGGLPLEFCNLRHDHYSDTSRVPVVRPGTPLEDAQRRDFTVNALFYNLNTEMVEDYCGGLGDIDRRVLRCPLAPYETFLDDPLRMLRGVRFAGHLGFQLDEAVSATMLQPPPRPPPPMPYPFTCPPDVFPLHPLANALIVKVARERAEKELHKMLSGNDPGRCVRLLHELGALHATVLVEAHFTVKPKTRTSPPDLVLPIAPNGFSDAVINVATETIEVVLATLGPARVPNNSAARLIASLTAVLATTFAVTAPVFAEKAAQPAQRAEAVSARWLRFPNYATDAVAHSLEAVALLRPHRDAVLQSAAARAAVIQEETDDDSTVAPGASRGIYFHGEARTALYHAMRVLQGEKKNVAPTDEALGSVAALLVVDPALNSPMPIDTVAASTTARSIVEAIHADSSGGLLAMATRAPVIKGSDLAAVGGLKVERKEIGTVLKAQMLFMLHNPTATVSEVAAYLRSTFAPQP